jgi:adenine deaminase
MKDMATFIEGMPKADLHLHIEGALEPEMKFEMAARNGFSLPYKTVNEVVASYDFHDLASFLDARYEGDSVLITERDFYELAMSYYRRVHSENVIYAEIFFDPQAHTKRGVEFSTVIEGLHRARNDASSELGIDSQLIMCFWRDLSAESATETLTQAEPYRDWIVGVGLDSEERGNPPVKFKSVYKDAAEQGYRLTAHCDPEQEDSVSNIWQALTELGVERIDHGTNAVEDGSLVQALVDRKIGLTVCPVSNKAIVHDSKSRELKTLLDQGVQVTVNSDDPAYFLGYMTDNLKTAQAGGDLTAEEVTQLIRNAFSISWTSDAAKASYLQRLGEYATGAGV